MPTRGFPAPTPRSRRTGAPRRFVLRRAGWVQAWQLTRCGLSLAAGRLWGALADRLGQPDARARRRQARQLHEARRLARTLGELKGPFAKAGQFATLRVDLLTQPQREALGALRDRCPPRPAGEIRAVVEEELGATLEARFEEFSPSPLGAASLAQAHRARVPGVGPVVVKVQYPWLTCSLPADLRWLERVLRVLTRGRIDPPARERLFTEFRRGLSQELDFRHEARVAAEIAANLAEDPQILVPEVVPSHSTRRVLTTRWHPVVSVGDRAGLARLGVSRAELLEVLARAYAKQVFVDGVFHADPHPGNLFVVDEPEAARRPRVLFVDFGLSRRLGPELRRELRQGLYALLRWDLEGFLAGMDRLGMIAPGAEPAARRAVEAIFVRLRGEADGPLALGAGRVLALKDEASALLAGTPGLQLPSELLLWARTLSTLFALGAEVAPEVDLMKLSTPYLLRFLAAKD